MIRRICSTDPPRVRGPSGSACAVLLLACLTLLAGCRLDLTVEAVVEPDGAGTVVLATGFDAALLRELDRLGVDPTAELEATAAAIAGWEVERRSDEGGLVVRAVRAVDDAERIGDVLRELAAGLGETDPALLIDLEVDVDADGGVEVAGTARFRPPATVGVSLDDTPVGPRGDELAAIVASGVDAQLRLQLPGAVVAHDGDRLEGRSVVWELPAGDEVRVSASAAPAGWWTTIMADGSAIVLTAASAVLLVAGAFGWRARRVRRSA